MLQKESMEGQKEQLGKHCWKSSSIITMLLRWIRERSVALVVDLAKSFDKVKLNIVWAWALHFGFPQRVRRVLCGYTFSTSEE